MVAPATTAMVMEERKHGSEEELEYYSLNERVYARLAPFYELVTLPIVRVRREVTAIAGVDSRSRVLDVATGTGAQARAFAERASEVVGIDLSESMLRVARAKNRFANLTFRRCDANELPFADGSFDVSCISFALHEMPGSIREGVLAQMACVTKRGGAVLIVDYGRRCDRFGDVLDAVVKLYEGERYAEFIRSDLPGLLRRSAIDVRDDRTTLLGAVRIVTGCRR